MFCFFSQVKLQFRLKSLMFLIFALAVMFSFLSYEFRVVRKRRIELDEIRAHGGGVQSEENAKILFKFRNFTGDRVLPTIPWIRRMLGDVPIYKIYIPVKDQSLDEQRLREIFNESLVVRENPGPP